MNSVKVKRALAAAFLAVSSIAARAGYLGSTVEARAYSPDFPPGNDVAVQAVVGAGVEFSNGQFGALFLGPTFDFADTTITITHAAGGSRSWHFQRVFLF